jgi:hypothetical protein
VIRRLLIGLVWAVPAYLAGAFGGGWLTWVLSSNQHDRDMEAGMTGAFFFGPLVAVIGFVVGLVRGGPRAAPSPDR